MEYFKFRRKHLYCEDVKVKDLADKYGTPLYVYSYRNILGRFNQLKKEFSRIRALICYSAKANSNLSVLKALIKEGAGLDIVSGGELYRAKRCGCPAKKIVYASVGKIEEEIKEAVNSGILMFNVESVPELERINHLAQKLKRKARVAIRINPDISPGTHKYITTGKKETKFGVEIDTAKRIFLNRNKYKSIVFSGIHIHIGSQITELAPFVKAIKKVNRLIGQLKEDNVRLEYLNIGGGLGIDYGIRPAKTAKEFAGAVMPLLKGTGLKIILEPGRFITGNAGILVSKVIYLKENSAKKFVVVDAAMNDFIRPSLYGAAHRIIPVRLRAMSHDLKAKQADVVGPVCESGDFLGKNVKISVGQGDYLAVLDTGAYGYSMASNYNSRLKPAEVLVKNNKAYLVTERQSYQDLVRKEIII